MKLSIITINYNNKAGLQKTLDSVLAQTCKDFEWIVIDGGSTDGSKDLIEQHQDAMAYWCSEHDRGVYHAMNKGIVEATGEYCLFLNSGDRFHDINVVTNILPSLDGTDFVSGDEWHVNEDYSLYKMNINPSCVSKYHFLVGILWHQCTFIRTEMLKKHPYDESLKIAADWGEMFYEYVINDRSYKHIDVVVSDFVVGGASENDWDLLCAERKYVRDKYLTQRQQDEIALEYHSRRDESFSKRYMAELAYTAFANNYYSQQEYLEVFAPYRKILISNSTTYHRFFNFICLSGLMNTARVIYRCLFVFK